MQLGSSGGIDSSWSVRHLLTSDAIVVPQSTFDLQIELHVHFSVGYIEQFFLLKEPIAVCTSQAHKYIHGPLVSSPTVQAPSADTLTSCMKSSIPASNRSCVLRRLGS